MSKAWVEEWKNRNLKVKMMSQNRFSKSSESVFIVAYPISDAISGRKN